ncbi:MAG: hypothetical protein U9N86_10845 [Bacteroidota bacterium]|nr:hypothetical protein [Bacteroidota bacterium]
MDHWPPGLLSGLLSGGVALTIAGFGFAYVRGKIIQTLNEHALKIIQLHNGLYKEDGTLVYLPKEDFDARQIACFANQQKAQDRTCYKLEEIKRDLSAIGDKREIEAGEFRKKLVVMDKKREESTLDYVQTIAKLNIVLAKLTTEVAALQPAKDAS